MCGIVGSLSKEKIKELAKLNSQRGNKTYSITVINNRNEVVYCNKTVGKFEDGVLESGIDFKVENPYYILHIQSPTKVTGNSLNTIHPATDNKNDTHLWHNGMLLERNLNTIKEEYNYESDWDTGLLLEVVNSDYNNLKKVEGSFACLHLKDKTFTMFRNRITPLYIDEELNISSVPFNGSQNIEFNNVFEINLKTKKYSKIMDFDNAHNPYKF